MKKAKIILISLIIIGFYSCSQKLTCADFKTGTFYIPENKEIRKYRIEANDSISEMIQKRDLSIKKWIVVRDEKTQIEWINGIGNGIPEYEIIEWIDECTYRLTYDDSKSELNDEKKWVNENNGIVITKTKIEKNCLYYKATLTTKDGQKISQNGIICK